LTREATVSPTALAEIRQAFVWGVFVQVASLAFSLIMILDMGELFRRVVMASIVYWCFVIMFALRGARPTNVDLFMIKYGVWPFSVLVVLIASLLGR
jgi:hypothetical protein